MPIKPNFSFEDISRRFDNFLDAVEEASVRLLEYLGEKCVIEARTNHTYTDQTGALTSSIGYVVFKNGEAVRENFEVFRPFTSQKPDYTWKVNKKGESKLKANAPIKATPEEGIEMGKSLAEKVGKETKGLTLVVVAG